MLCSLRCELCLLLLRGVIGCTYVVSVGKLEAIDEGRRTDGPLADSRSISAESI